MHRDIVHVPGPNQKRIRRIGRALVAVAAALDHQAQVIFAGKIHGLSDVMGISCRDRVNARFGSPCVDPSQGLRESRLIADVIWIFQVLRETLGGGACRIGFDYRKRKVYRNQISADCVIESLPRRLRWPRWHRKDGAGGNSYLPTGGAAKSAGAPPIRLLSRMLFCSLTLTRRALFWSPQFFGPRALPPIRLRFSTLELTFARRVVLDGAATHHSRGMIPSYF